MTHKKILLIDDDPDDHLIFLDAIDELGLGLECCIATNGLEALAHLSTGWDLPTIIFLDLNMPVMNGIEFLEEMRKENLFDEIPVVILTTSANLNDKMRSSELGAKAFFTKTSNTKILGEKLRKILDTDYSIERKIDM